MSKAVFLDRDGVLVEDTGLIVDERATEVLPGVCEALSLLHGAGFLLIVVSNQTVLARGLLDEKGVIDLEKKIEDRMCEQGAPALDGFYFCGHHPRASLSKWRSHCQCRKPAPGLLLQAAEDLNVELAKSYMVGDRPSDVAAGKGAGCKTVLLETGRHADPPIETAGPFEPSPPDMIFADLLQAAKEIVRQVEP